MNARQTSHRLDCVPKQHDATLVSYGMDIALDELEGGEARDWSRRETAQVVLPQVGRKSRQTLVEKTPRLHERGKTPGHGAAAVSFGQ
eukprot:scaffold176089_cov28-Tisochrysis_lutea.AAC.3